MNLVTTNSGISTMTKNDIILAQEAEKLLKNEEQLFLTTHHTLHGGMYTRTINLQAGTTITGALIKVPTTLFMSGHLSVFTGHEVQELEGVHIFTASVGRKQVITAIKDSVLTMAFATDAETIEEAENEFTDEADKLISRYNKNIVNITGEKR